MVIQKRELCGRKNTASGMARSCSSLKKSSISILLWRHNETRKFWRVTLYRTVNREVAKPIKIALKCRGLRKWQCAPRVM